MEHLLWAKDYAEHGAYNGIQENPQTLPSWSLKSRLPRLFQMPPPLGGLP